MDFTDIDAIIAKGVARKKLKKKERKETPKGHGWDRGKPILTTDAEALVVLKVTTTCKNCKNSYIHPSPQLMVRVKEHIVTPKKNWTLLHKILPRELREVSLSCESCHECYQAADLGFMIDKKIANQKA